MNRKLISLMLLVALVTTFTSVKAADKDAKKIPNFSLKDPVGKIFTTQDIIKDGAVVVVTAPILSNKNAQEGWSDRLTETQGSNKASFILLEDMEPSSFKGTALKEMKKEYKPGKPPILLIDHDGSVRKKFGVAEKKTVVLVYNQDGELVHRIDDKPSAQAAKEAWKKVGGQ